MKGFVALILTHGRPGRVLTYVELRRSGYTGPIRPVVDDEDAARGEYEAAFPGEVLVFSKREAAALFDAGDNEPGRKGVVYARNACWALAREAGFQHFVALDDDYISFFYRWGSALKYGQWRVKTTLDACFATLVEYLESSPALLAVCMSQGGDHIGGKLSPQNRNVIATRKAMNSFVCSVDRPFSFDGRFNEDVSAYVVESGLGRAFLTFQQIQLNQVATQAGTGGMTGAYLESGTYVKTWHSVMRAPSCVRVSSLSDPRSPHARIHHWVDWSRAAALILPERCRKDRP